MTPPKSMDEALLRSGLSSAEFATLMGRSKMTVSHWLNSDTLPTPEACILLASFIVALETEEDQDFDCKRANEYGTTTNTARRCMTASKPSSCANEADD